MATAFVLDEFGPERISVSDHQGWIGRWKNVSVQLDGKEVLSVASRDELKAGCETKTDLGMLRVQLKNTFFSPKIVVSLDGRRLQTDPAKRFKAAYRTIYAVAVLSVAIGLLTVALNNETLNAIGLGWGAVVEGCIFGILGFWTQRRLSLVALSIALGLVVLDTILTFVPLGTMPPTVQAGGNSGTGWLLVRAAIMWELAQGIRALPAMKRRRDAAS